MPLTLFYSWQLDRPAKTGRNLIERALQRAIGILREDIELDEPIRDSLEVDRDTKGVAGTPPIVETIFNKIDAASIFVPDLTFAGLRVEGRPTPNPNVLIEYGWALKQHGHGRMVAVMNTAYGKPSSETLPFDMQHLRHPIQYDCADDADDATRSAAQASLAKALASAIRDILKGISTEREVAENTHPETITEAMPLIKRYCRDNSLAMEWTELLDEEAKRVRANVEAVAVPTNLDNAYLSDSFDRLASASEKLMVMLGLCARWGTPESINIALRTIRSLGMRTELRGGFQYLNELRDVPASLCYNAMMVASVDRQDYVAVLRICDSLLVREGEELPFVTTLSMQSLISGGVGWKFLKGLEQRKLPHSEALFRSLQPTLDALNVDASARQQLVDQTESIITLEFSHKRLQKMKKVEHLWFWTTFGDYLFRSHGNGRTPLLRHTADKQEMIDAGLFGGTREAATAAADSAMDCAGRITSFF